MQIESKMQDNAKRCGRRQAFGMNWSGFLMIAARRLTPAAKTHCKRNRPERKL